MSDFFVRMLPHADPIIQGTFRNSMIAEARADWYMILDADELYTPNSFRMMLDAVMAMELEDKLYGVLRRVEVCSDLRTVYSERRTHHRLYHRQAIWKGNHPGEVAFYPQNKDSEIHFPRINTWHFHNAARSSKDNEVPKRLARRGQGTYHPGNPEPIDLLKELPILRKPIEDFPVNPALLELQRAESVQMR